MSRDEAYLLDILLAARDAVSFVEGLDWERFNASKLHQGAVVRTLEVIGEAAQRISDTTKVKSRGYHGGSLQACGTGSYTNISGLTSRKFGIRSRKTSLSLSPSWTR